MPDPSSVFANHDGLVGWPGPDPPTSTSDCFEYGFLGALSKTPRDLSGCGSVSKNSLFFFDSGNNVSSNRLRGPQMGKRHRTRDLLTP